MTYPQSKINPTDPKFIQRLRSWVRRHGTSTVGPIGGLTYDVLRFVDDTVSLTVRRTSYSLELTRVVTGTTVLSVNDAGEVLNTSGEFAYVEDHLNKLLGGFMSRKPPPPPPPPPPPSPLDVLQTSVLKITGEIHTMDAELRALEEDLNGHEGPPKDKPGATGLIHQTEESIKGLEIEARRIEDALKAARSDLGTLQEQKKNLEGHIRTAQLKKSSLESQLRATLEQGAFRVARQH
jgi:hypothetical protein